MPHEEQPETTFTPIAEVGEFGLIARIQTLLSQKLPAEVLQGIGDDAAVYRIGEQETHVLTTDVLIEGVHFDRMFTPMTHLGYKALSVNVSDVAAMNALPLYATVNLGLPNYVSVEMVEDLYRGLARAAAQYGMYIVGGDTSAARQLIVGITVVGRQKEARVVYRRGARVGDLICVTGDLGGAYAGLKVLMENKRIFLEEGQEKQPDLEPYTYVIKRHLLPQARMDVIQAWEKAHILPHALIDISDGLASEIHHICTQSGTGAELFAPAIPIHLETRRVADVFGDDVDTYALFGGEDYELLFTLPEDTFNRLPEGLATVIGKITDAASGIRIQTGLGTTVRLEPSGYQHFTSDEAS